jgi:hypothetical protein
MAHPFSVLATDIYNEALGRASFEHDTLIGLLLAAALAVRPRSRLHQLCTERATQVMRPLSVALPTWLQIAGRAVRDPWRQSVGISDRFPDNFWSFP